MLLIKSDPFSQGQRSDPTWPSNTHFGPFCSLPSGYPFISWSHLVSLWVGTDGVLGSQGDAARYDHQEDGHLEVAKSDNVVTNFPDTASTQRRKEMNTMNWALTVNVFEASYGLEALKMNMLSGAGATRFGGVWGSSSSVSSSLSGSYTSKSLLFTKTQWCHVILIQDASKRAPWWYLTWARAPAAAAWSFQWPRHLPGCKCCVWGRLCGSQILGPSRWTLLLLTQAPLGCFGMTSHTGLRERRHLVQTRYSPAADRTEEVQECQRRG